MKKYFSFLAFFSLAILVIPSFSFFLYPAKGASQNVNSFKNTSTLIDESSPPFYKELTLANDYFFVQDYVTKKITKLSARDYVIGAVCAEMPASFHEEALKAQAVAAHTYAIRQRERELRNPTPELNGAYFSNDPDFYQAYFTEEQAKDFYGENFEENYKKISNAVDEVIHDVIVYNNEPIVAAFHAMSSGTTEDAKTVWGNKVDYLVPVDSSSDTKLPNFTETKTFTSEEIKARLTTAYPEIKLPDDTEKWLRIVDITESGTVTSIITGNIVIDGFELKKILSLRSSCFSIDYSNNIFTITTKGYGHNVGLSQYGADSLAKQGMDYKKILLHYYKGVEIVTI